MTAYYKLYKNPTDQKDTIAVSYHPRFVNQTTTRMKKVLHMASAFSTFSSADIIGVLEVLKNVLVMELASGHVVELEGFGTFTVSLKCPPLCNKEDIQTEYVEFKTVKMRVAADLKNRVRAQMKLSKAPDEDLPRLNPYQRKMVLVQYLMEEGYITAKEYRLRTNLCKDTAAKDLKKFVKEGLILSRGNGPTTFYVLKE